MSMAALPILALVAFLCLPDATLIPPAQAAGAHRGKSKPAGKDFAYTVSDCHADGELDSIRLELAESSVTFTQVLTMNCIAATRPGTVTLSYAKQGRTLEVSIVLRSAVLSDCTCPIGIEGTIANLGKGAYRIVFIFDHPPEGSANGKPIRQTLTTKEFSIQ
jgi:hypothetical protein